MISTSENLTFFWKLNLRDDKSQHFHNNSVWNTVKLGYNEFRATAKIFKDIFLVSNGFLTTCVNLQGYNDIMVIKDKCGIPVEFIITEFAFCILKLRFDLGICHVSRKGILW